MVMERFWAIKEESLGVVQSLVKGVTETPASKLWGGSPVRSDVTGVGVLPVYGPLVYRADRLYERLGFTSIQTLQEEFKAMLGNPRVSSIVLNVDSPGGSVDGVMEFSDMIYNARQKKRIVAIANTMAASAAYWIASAAENLAVTPSGEVGSIGVYMLHQDMSAAYEQKGIQTTLIKAGRRKAEANPWNPLDEEAKASLQSQIDAHYDMFVKAVARNRAAPVDVVRKGFGEGRTVMAREAVRLGMADKVATMEDVLKSVGVKSTRASSLAFGGNGLSFEERQRILEMF